jgi:lipoprotein-releasing system permease protein
LKLSYFIAQRIAFNRQKTFSRFIIRLSVAATAFSVTAMIVTLSFVNGFQKAVSEKVFSFWGHIRVQHYEPNKSLIAEETPITKNDTVELTLQHQKDIVTIQPFATKSAVLQHEKEIEGILLKGVDKKYDSIHLNSFIKKGRWLQFNDSLYSKEIIISASIADELKINVNDTVNISFISSDQLKTATRKLKVVGIYKTGIEEYDKLFAIGDIQLIRRINNWQPNEIGGYEIFIKDYHLMDSVAGNLTNTLPTEWMASSIKEVYPNIFDWLQVQDVNRNVIFIIMSIVAIINLITCLLILVLERTRMIGILKAIGANNITIEKIFLYQAGFITLAGVGFGFIAGAGLCLLQQYTGLLKLDETNYYVSVAPVQIIWWQVITVCLATAIICFVALVIPAFIIKKIKPVKAIQFR